MEIWELLLLAAALAMDAFAVSICKGLASKTDYVKTGLACGVWFGFFQALMPFLGWLLASFVADYVENVSAYIAFVLLAFLGIKMLIETYKECGCCEESADETEKNASLAPRVMLVFAIATSIDAMAAGVTLAVEKEPRVLLALSLIGGITFFFCFIGAAIGAKLGAKWKTPAGIAGGTILVLLGLKALIQQIISYF